MSALCCQNQRCLKLGTTSCGRCRGIPERHLIGTSSVPYCSNACVEADAKAHEPLCSTRRDHRALFRMVALLREVFYVYRQHTFDRVIESWTEGRPGIDNFDVSVKEGVYDVPVIMQDLVKPFPESLAARKDLRDAVLAYLCPNAAGLMHDLVEYAFKDMDLAIIEHKIASENDQKSRVVLRGKDGDILKLRGYPTVYEITTKNGRKYVFDLTAARDESPQNVKDCAVWRKWLSNRTPLKMTVTAFGTRKAEIGHFPESPALPFLLTLVDVLAADVVYGAVKELERDDKLGMSLSNICMKLDETAYDGKVAELLEGIVIRLKCHHSKARVELDEAVENTLMAEARMSITEQGMSITTVKAKCQVPEEDPPTTLRYQRTSRYQRFQQGGYPTDESIKPATEEQQPEPTYKVEEREVYEDEDEKDEDEPEQRKEDQHRKWKSVKTFLRRIFKRQGMSS